MLTSRTRRRGAGFTLIEVMAVTGLMAGLHSQGNYQYALSKANEIKGLQQLRQLHLLLQMQAMTGGLPRAAFYPKGDPLKDPKSIVRLVQGAPPQLFVSPFAPQALKRRGLTYAWNDTVNGKHLSAVPGNTWLLIDLAAFIADPRVPRPRKYLVLYASGRTQAVTTPPPDILKAVQAARAKAKKKAKESSKPKKSSAKPRRSVPKAANKRIPRIGTIPLPPSLPGL